MLHTTRYYTGIPLHDKGVVSAAKGDDLVDSHGGYNNADTKNTLPNYLTQAPTCHDAIGDIDIQEELLEE